jgi:predicted RNase H-like HicB family nuclease
MSEPRRFQVVFEPDEGGAWHAYIPAVAGCRTWGRSLGAARRYIRDALSTCVDVLGEDADRIARDAVLEEQIVLEGNAQKVLDDYLHVRRKADELQELAQACAVDAAKTLTTKVHLSLRDTGELLGLSHERVNQVVHSRASGRLSAKESYEVEHFKKLGRVSKTSGSTFTKQPIIVKGKKVQRDARTGTFTKKPQARGTKGAA